MATQSSPMLPLGHSTTPGLRTSAWRVMFKKANADNSSDTTMLDPFESSNAFRNEADDAQVDFTAVSKELHLTSGRLLVNHRSAGNLEIWCGFSVAAKTADIQVFGFDFTHSGELASVPPASLDAFVDAEQKSGQGPSNLKLGLSHNLCLDDPYAANRIAVAATAEKQTLSFVAGPHQATRIPVHYASGTAFYMSKVIRFTSVPYYSYLVYVPRIDAGTTLLVLGRTY